MTEDKLRYLLPMRIDCYKPTCYMYGPSLSITDRSVDKYTVHSFKNNKLVQSATIKPDDRAIGPNPRFVGLVYTFGRLGRNTPQTQSSQNPIETSCRLQVPGRSIK